MRVPGEDGDDDQPSGYRRYAPAQLERARLVATLRLVGMPLARIDRVLEGSRAEAPAMATSTHTLHATFGTSHRRGGRDRQQDAYVATPELVAVADGHGDRDDLAARALAAFGAEDVADAVAAAVVAAGEPDNHTVVVVDLS